MALLYRMGTGNGSGGDIKPYTVNFECANGYIGQTLTMTYQGTEVVDNVSGTVGSDGMLTLYPMHSGIWECSCYSSVTGKTMTKTIDLSYWGIQPTVAFEDTPDGATVTPIDDVQTWLHCANIWDKSYTTVVEVIADTTLFNNMISNENANDYLVRSTDFASVMCNDSNAMTYIGNNNNCSILLLQDTAWGSAIANSTYFEKVLNAKIPTMVSNTSPSGTAYANNEANGNAYQAFDKNETTYWGANIGVNNNYVGYRFPSKVFVKRFEPFISQNSGAMSVTLQALNDEGAWETISDAYTFPKYNTTRPGIITKNTKGYSDFRIVCTYTDSYSSLFNWLKEAQLYGRNEV